MEKRLWPRSLKTVLEKLHNSLEDLRGCQVTAFMARKDTTDIKVNGSSDDLQDQLEVLAKATAA